LKDYQGNLKDKWAVDNLIVDDGWDHSADAVSTDGAQPAPAEWLGIGTGTTGAAAGDSALETEISTGGGERAGGTYAHSAGTKIWTLVNTWNFTSSFAVTEAGVLNASTAGALLSRQVFSAKNVASGDSLQVTWTFTGS